MRKCPRAWRVAGLLAAGLAFLAAWWLLPPLVYGGADVGPDARLKAVTDTRTALLAGLVGIGALLTFSLNRRALRTTEQGHITDRYNKAVELLGSQCPDMRVGGVYALRRIMEDSERDHAAVVDLLVVFVCERARTTERTGTVGPVHAEKRRPAADVQAALNVLANRPDRPHEELDRLRLADTDLRGSILRDARFRGANLRRAWLQEAHLERANFEQASMRDVKLADADLEATRLTETDLPGADLRGARNIEVAQLVKARIYRSTKLDPHVAEDEAVRARINECERRKVEAKETDGSDNL